MPAPVISPRPTRTKNINHRKDRPWVGFLPYFLSNSFAKHHHITWRYFHHSPAVGIPLGNTQYTNVLKRLQHGSRRRHILCHFLLWKGVLPIRLNTIFISPETRNQCKPEVFIREKPRSRTIFTGTCMNLPLQVHSVINVCWAFLAHRNYSSAFHWFCLLQPCISTLLSFWIHCELCLLYTCTIPICHNMKSK